jgi:hypothetical protein
MVLALFLTNISTLMLLLIYASSPRKLELACKESLCSFGKRPGGGDFPG